MADQRQAQPKNDASPPKEREKEQQHQLTQHALTAGPVVSRRTVVGTGALAGVLALAGMRPAAASAANTSAEPVIASNVTALRALDVRAFSDGQPVLLLGHTYEGDGGEGWFTYQTTPATVTDDDGIVFVPTTGSGHFARLWDRDGVRVEWFGADRTGKTAATTAIQHAIDYAIQHRIQEVHLGDGIFLLDDTLHLGWGVSLATVSLIGAGPNYLDAGFSGTLLKAPFKDRPAIAIQGARFSAVRHLAIEGANFGTVVKRLSGSGATATALIDPTTWVDQTFLSGAPLADSQHAPYAGIAIDPYSGPKPSDAYPDVNYPAWVGSTTQYGKDFSSGVQIEDVEVFGFVVGIVIQPCNADGNGDFTRISRCMLVANKYGISIGNGQSRNVEIRNLTYEYQWTTLTNTVHGHRTGRFDGPIENISGGVSYQLADIALNASGALRFVNVYIESQLRIGRLGGNAAYQSPVIFDGCTLGPSTGLYGYSVASFIDAAPYTTLHFIGCTFDYFGKFLNLVSGGPAVVFDSCTFVGDGLRAGTTWSTAEKLAQDYLCGGVFCASGSVPVQIAGGINAVRFAGGASPGAYVYSGTVVGNRSVINQGADRLSYTHANYPGNFVELHTKPVRLISKSAEIASPGVSVNGSQITFTNNRQTTVYACAISVGDLLLDQASNTLFVVSAVNGQTITADIATNWHLSSGAVVPNAAIDPTKGYIALYPTTAFKTDLVYRGDVTAGSAVIASIRRPDGAPGAFATVFQPGDLLFYSDELWDTPHPFPPVTRVVATDATAHTITVDQKALITATGVTIAMVG
jgi:hypothetical protein